MSLRGGKKYSVLPQRVIAALVVLAGLSAVTGAEAALLPKGFFDVGVTPGDGAAAVEADRLAYDEATSTISAEGGVVMHYHGYAIRADKVVYDQRTGELHASGNVTMQNPDGILFESDSVDVTGDFKEAILNSLTITTVEGSRITARDARYSATLASVLTDAAYSPCGLCEDEKGRRIGWRVKAARITYDRKNASVFLDQPSLELLGIPVAWLPWFWMPDPTQPRATGMRMPFVDSDAKRGAVVGVPFFVPVGTDVDVVFSPQLLSNQGALMAADMNWRLPGLGTVEISASGLYQLNPGAFAGTIGSTLNWRGAIQTAGSFTPAPHWRAGWSYTAFTDTNYLTDYKFTDATSWLNEAYGTYLDDLTWFDIRAQEFNQLGSSAVSNDPAQGKTLPVAQFETTYDLEAGWGRLHASGKLLSVTRGAAQTGTYNGVPYVFGAQGNKQHLMLEGAWEDQFILPGGVAATPYLGLRADAAGFDDTTLANADSTLFSLTPIAALDVRWPLVAFNGADTHLVEPIMQIVYRGTSTSAVGITNDDAHSFVFDSSNIFSYNRFSGIDRQETGLRANIGGHYVGNFADGSWLDVVAGQSFQLAGTNAFGLIDPVRTGVGAGLSGSASFIVAGLSGGWSNGISGAAKVQVDPSGLSVTRFGAGLSYANAGWTASGTYIYLAPNAAAGTTAAQHEVVGDVGVPVFDYWKVTAGLTWDIDKGSWVEARGGVSYDDGYLGASGFGTIRSDASWTVGMHLSLKGPDGELAF